MNQINIIIQNTSPSVCIRSNDVKLLQHVYNNFVPFVFWGKAVEKDFFCIYIYKDKNSYFITYNEQKFIALNDKQLFRTIGKVINCVISTDYPFIAIHGAVLSKDGYNYVFVGPTGAGKSTLSAYLSSKGYRYYSDDKSLINCNSGEIIPFFKPIHLRIDAKTILEKKYKIAVKGEKHSFKSEERYYSNLPYEEIDCKSKLRIIFIERNCKKTKSIIKLSNADAINRIIYNLIYIKNLRLGVKLALQLVSNIECFDLCYYHLNEVEELLNQI